MISNGVSPPGGPWHESCKIKIGRRNPYRDWYQATQKQGESGTMSNGINTPDIPSFIFSKTRIPVLHKSLDAYSKRQKSIADNIANINTPGFRRSEVRFEEELKKTLDKEGIQGRRTHEKHMPIGRMDLKDLKPRYVLPDDPTLRSGQNNVDIDQEMAELAKNQIRFQAASQLMAGQFNSLKSAIRGESVR